MNVKINTYSLECREDPMKKNSLSICLCQGQRSKSMDVE